MIFPRISLNVRHIGNVSNKSHKSEIDRLLYKQTNLSYDKSFHFKEMVTSVAVLYKLDVED